MSRSSSNGPGIHPQVPGKHPDPDPTQPQPNRAQIQEYPPPLAEGTCSSHPPHTDKLIPEWGAAHVADSGCSRAPTRRCLPSSRGLGRGCLLAPPSGPRAQGVSHPQDQPAGLSAMCLCRQYCTGAPHMQQLGGLGAMQQVTGDCSHHPSLPAQSRKSWKGREHSTARSLENLAPGQGFSGSTVRGEVAISSPCSSC